MTGIIKTKYGDPIRSFYNKLKQKQNLQNMNIVFYPDEKMAYLKKYGYEFKKETIVLDDDTYRIRLPYELEVLQAYKDGVKIPFEFTNDKYAQLNKLFIKHFKENILKL